MAAKRVKGIFRQGRKGAERTQFAIHVPKKRSPVGVLYVQRVQPGMRSYAKLKLKAPVTQIGLQIHPAWRGKGLGTQAYRFARTQTTTEIAATISRTNRASIRAAKKAGFTKGRRDVLYARSDPHDLYQARPIRSRKSKKGK